MDTEFVERLMKIDNFDQTLAEMIQSWPKFHGEKFIFEHLSKQSDEFIAAISKFEGKIDDVTNFTADIVLESGGLYTKGLFLEYKSWSKNSFTSLMGKDQFKKQLKNYIKEGNFEYIFNRQKLIRDKVADPDAFVRGKFQKVFRENAEELFKQNPNFFKKIDLGANEYINSWEMLKKVATDNEAFEKIGNIFLKVE